MSEERPESGQSMPETPANEPQAPSVTDSPTAEFPAVKAGVAEGEKAQASMQTRTAAPEQATYTRAQDTNVQLDNQKSDKKSKKAKKKKRKKAIPWVGIVLVLCVVLSAMGGITFGRDLTVPADASNTKTIEVEIESGMPVSGIGQMLEDTGVIRSATAFKLYVRVQGAATNIQAGIHELSPSMTLEEVVQNLQKGAATAGVVKIAVAEGLTVDQIADVVADSTKYSKEDFLAVMTDDAFLQELVSKYPFLEISYSKEDVRYVLEGYLFPATYEFDEETGLHALVKQMLDKTASVLEKYQSEIDASEYNLQQIMTIASLVEKEGQTTEDRRLIAGVFYNRLKEGMAIQSDISVLYALGTHKELVTFEDLEVDSPYNLYANTGLSPGPLNNPSEDAIAAALNPTESDYIYFYANIKTGEVFYTSDYDQHLAWQKEYEETGDIKGENFK